jgi:lambda family phage portal protein
VAILDQNGDVMQPQAQASTLGAAFAYPGRAHEGASLSGDLSAWLPALGSSDADLIPDLPMLVSRQRDLIRNHGLASGAMQTFVDNVLGVDLRLQAQPDWRLLGRDEAWASEWATVSESLWQSWTQDPDFGSDVRGLTNFAGLSHQVFRGVMGNGAGLAVVNWLPEVGRVFATALQVVEADRLINPLGRIDDATFRSGVEIDSQGRPVAYHIANRHPGDMMALYGGMPEITRIESRMPWGRRRVIHVFDPTERAESHHGKPSFSAILGEFRTLGEYQKAELQAALTNAMVAAILEAPMDGATLQELFGSGQNYIDQRNSAAPVKMKRGAVLRTFPGEHLNPFTPGRPNDAFAPFMDSLLHIMAAGLNLPYELLAKDFSKVNYSSARAALLEAWRHFRGRRAFMATYWHQQVYLLLLEEWVNRGLLDAPDFYQKRYAYARARWNGPGRGWVDPQKEAAAAETRMALGISTFEDECAEQGVDWEGQLAQLKREVDRFASMGLQHPYMRPRAGQPGQSLAVVGQSDSTEPPPEEPQ